MLTIKDLIQQARREIEAAARERIDHKQAPLMAVESVTIEVNVVVTESGEGTGAFDLKVITASGKKGFEHQQVQKITVVLKTIDQTKRALHAFDLAVPSNGPSPAQPVAPPVATKAPRR